MKTKRVMNGLRVWIEIVLLATAVALALGLLLATLGAAAATAVGQTGQVTVGAHAFEGMITCSRCGAKHQPALDRSASNCVRVCVHGGAVFALIADDSVYLLDGDLGSLKRLAGQRARVTGTRTGNTIKVASITSAS